jgi:hypothetical protein
VASLLAREVQGIWLTAGTKAGSLQKQTLKAKSKKTLLSLTPISFCPTTRKLRIIKP